MSADCKRQIRNYEEEDTLVVQKVSLPEMCTNFRDFAFSKGVSIEIPSVRSIFAAIATAKIVFLNSTNTELLPKLLEIINEYFASTGVSQASTEWSSPKDLLWKNDGEKLVVSEFTKAVHQASVEKKKNCVAILNNVSMENLNSYFGQFIQFAIYPTEEHNVAINETLSIKLPTNICYILVPSEYDYLEKISRDVAKASVSIDVVIIEPEEEHEEVAIKPVNVLDFKELVNEAKEKFYLEEKIWKKIDLFIETIKLSEKFTIGNKNTLQLERFTSVFMECGGDEADAFNAGFSAKYVPILKTLKLYKNENGDRTILSYIEKEFSDEDISKISKTLLKKDH